MMEGQGVKCTNCEFTAHHECKGQIPIPPCGLDVQEKRGRTVHLGFSTERLSEKKWCLNIQGNVYLKGHI